MRKGTLPILTKKSSKILEEESMALVHPESALFVAILIEKYETGESSGTRPRSASEKTLQEIKDTVKDLPNFFGTVFCSGHQSMLDLMVENFPDVQPVLRFVNDLEEDRRVLLKQKYPLAYLQAVRWEFLHHFGRKNPMCLPPNPFQPLQKLEFNRMNCKVTFGGKDYPYTISEESLMIDGEIYQLLDSFGVSTFQFEETKYQFYECFLFDRPIFGSLLLYSGLHAEQRDNKNISIDLELLKGQYFKAYPQYDTRGQDLSTSDDVFTFFDEMTVWFGTFEFVNDAFSSNIIFHYKTSRGYDEDEKPESIDVKVSILSVRKGHFSFGNLPSSTFEYEITFDTSPHPQAKDGNSVENYPRTFYFREIESS